MFKTTTNIMTALGLVFIFSFVAVAQQPLGDDSISEKGFKSKVLDVKYREPDSLTKVLRTLGSGFKGSLISPSSEFKTLTVRDFPENIAAIEEALKRLDTPVAPRPNIDLHMHVLIGSNTSGASAATTKPAPAELKDVLAQLSQTLNYKNYELATSIVQRITDTPRGLSGKGTAIVSSPEGAGPNAFLNMSYNYGFNSVSLASTSTGAPTIQIAEFSFVTASYPNGSMGTQISTALNLRNGEKVVVGTAAYGDRALIIVLTAKLLN